MIHKRHLAILALIWAAVVTLALWFIPRLNHALDWWNTPVILLAVLLSHLFGQNPLSPPNPVGWTAFAAYTIFYWVVFLIIYVVLLEIYLLRRVVHHLEDAKQNLLAEKPDSTRALAKLGDAVTELETHRRRHYLLQKLDLPDLPTDQRHVLGAHVLTVAGGKGPVKHMLKNLRRQLAAESSPLQAEALLVKLRSDAKVLVAQGQSHQGNAGGDGSSGKMPAT